MSYQLLSERQRTARKTHRCIWCGEPIAVGDRYISESSKYSGDFQFHRWHPECKEASHGFFADGHEEFEPGEFKRGAMTSKDL